MALPAAAATPAGNHACGATARPQGPALPLGSTVEPAILGHKRGARTAPRDGPRPDPQFPDCCFQYWSRVRRASGLLVGAGWLAWSFVLTPWQLVQERISPG